MARKTMRIPGEAREEIQLPDRSVLPVVLFGPLILLGVLAVGVEISKPWIDFFRSASWPEVRTTEARVQQRTSTTLGRFGQNRHTVYSCHFTFKQDQQTYSVAQSVVDSAQTDRCVPGALARYNPDDPRQAVMVHGTSAGMYYELFFVFSLVGIVVLGPFALRLHNRRQDRILARAREFPNCVWRWLPEWSEDAVVSRSWGFLSNAVLLTWLPPLLVVGTAVFLRGAELSSWALPCIAGPVAACAWIVWRRARRLRCGIKRPVTLIVPAGLPLRPGLAREVELVVPARRWASPTCRVELDLRWSSVGRSTKERVPESRWTQSVSLTLGSNCEWRGRFVLDLPNLDERQTAVRIVRWDLSVRHPSCGKLATLDLPVYGPKAKAPAETS